MADTFGAGELGCLAGLLHDLGKYSADFQRLLDGTKIKVDHSTAGAQQAIEVYGKASGLILAYLIAGHHAGLPDYGSIQDRSSLVSRLKNENIPPYGDYKREIDLKYDASKLKLSIKQLANNPGFSRQMLIRWLYSCLVDADFLDTEKFYKPTLAVTRESFSEVTLDYLVGRFNQYMKTKFGRVEQTPINEIRKSILDNCYHQSQQSIGFYTFTVPTGGGKTLASLQFALNHASFNELDRIIYVIPFTSIIEQNAQVFREALNKEIILEHHSNFQFDEANGEYSQSDLERIKLATENWSAPLVVTTNVQFFESIFANRSSRCRKLHNISRSVIILDEAQMLPTEYLKPCLLALAELVTNYGCTVVFCTATQPAITAYMPTDIQVKELAPDPHWLYQQLKRVKVENIGLCTDEQLVSRLSDHRQVLCIVNTRAHALKLYNMLDQADVYHLSARMCPVHRSKKLREIKNVLKNKQDCRLISTQLIEAGVDVDFPMVYRALCGLDSLAQAAGRCNREGKIQEAGKVYCFRPEHGLPGGWLGKTAEIGEMVMTKHEDPLSLEAIAEYFRTLYQMESLDKKQILSRIEERSSRLQFPFQWIADSFQIIGNNTSSLIIPYDDHCRQLLKQAEFIGPNSLISRGLQPYTIQIYTQELKGLLEDRAIKLVSGHYQALRDLVYYSEDTGLLSGKEGLGINDLLIV